MTPERYQRIGQLFDAALELAPEQRAAWLEQSCGADTKLRTEVENLLASYSDSQEFLSQPALNVVAVMLAQNHVPLTQGSQVNHYRILSLLGAGGMGEVYLAEDARLKRKVALKLLPAMLARDKERLLRFEQEAFAASALNHPNIVTIYEFGAEGEVHFLATEFIAGETLRAYLQGTPLPLDKTLDVAAQTAQALAAAHEAGIIHRDIKPENVMIRNDAIVKVLDFGLAKLVEPAPVDNEAETRMDRLTQPGTIMGTYAYMSPEQARGNPIDGRSDIFSLGVILYEMLTGHHPFLGETPSHTMVAILEKEPLPLAQFVADVPVDLELILNKALAKRASDRYSSAAALLADVKQLQKRLEFAAENVRARPLPNNEAATQLIRGQNNRIAGDTGEIAVQTAPVTLARPAHFWKAGALALAVAVAIAVGVAIWLWPHSRPVITPTQVAAALPERNLSYSLTVQKYRDGKLYQSEFQSSGREIFEPGWRFKLNLHSPQEGFLYLLNQEPSGSYVLLFPLPSRNSGSAHVEANEVFQTSWYVFDEKPGTEQFRLVWAEQSVPELERFRSLVNPQDQGRISDPAQIQVVNDFLQQHAASQLASVQDQQNRQTNVSGRGAVLVSLVELEHH